MKNLQSVSKKIISMLVSGITMVTPIHAMYSQKSTPVLIVSRQERMDWFSKFLERSLFNKSKDHNTKKKSAKGRKIKDKSVKESVVEYIRNNLLSSVNDVLDYSAELTEKLLRKGGFPCSFLGIRYHSQEFVGCDLYEYIKKYEFDGDLLSFCELYTLTLEYIFAIYYSRDNNRIDRFENIKFDFPKYNVSQESFEEFRNNLLEKLHYVLVDTL